MGQLWATIVSNQITFINLIYDSEIKFTGTMLRPQPFLSINLNRSNLCRSNVVEDRRIDNSVVCVSGA